MTKGRLEEIEKNLDPLGYGMGGHLISVNDIYWLVRYAKEQSERVQELEREIKSHAPNGRNYTNEQYIDLLHENKRYREILNASRGIIKDAIYALDNNKKVQGLEFAVKIINRALEGEE